MDYVIFFKDGEKIYFVFTEVGVNKFGQFF
jgi:hypothetical protein